MPNLTKKPVNPTQKFILGLFSGLGIGLGMAIISLGVYLVLAVAPGTTNPISPPPGNDVTWAPLTVDQATNRVGINNPTPNFTLDVNGQINAAGNVTTNAAINAKGDICTEKGGLPAKCLSSAGTGSLWTQSGSDIYYNTGNVGIGDTSPDYNLEVSTAVAGAADIFSVTADDDASVFVVSKDASDDGSMAIYDGSGNADIFFATDSSANSYINNGGNVGIGITDPGTNKLSVAGTIESTSGGVKFPDGTIQTTAAAGKKYCLVFGDANGGGGAVYYIGYAVPDSWTIDNCRTSPNPSHYNIKGHRVGCVWSNSINYGSFGSNSVNGGVPSPNCGW